MTDKYEHASMDPSTAEEVLPWLYDGYGGHLSEQARERIEVALSDAKQIRFRAEYLQREINIMRRAMVDAGTWEAFCADYAAYTQRHESEGT